MCTATASCHCYTFVIIKLYTKSTRLILSKRNACGYVNYIFIMSIQRAECNLCRWLGTRTSYIYISPCYLKSTKILNTFRVYWNFVFFFSPESNFSRYKFHFNWKYSFGSIRRHQCNPNEVVYSTSITNLDVCTYVK